MNSHDNLITVPACSNCNEKVFSKDDEYFRSVFAANERSKGNPDREGVIAAVQRSFLREGGFSTLVQSELRPQIRPTDSGLLRIRNQRAANAHRLIRTAARITTGLFYHHKGVRLPEDYAAQSMLTTLTGEVDRRAPGYEQFVSEMAFELIMGTDPYELGTAFTYWWRTSPSGWAVTHWIFRIYGDFAFFSITLPEGPFNPVPPAERVKLDDIRFE